LSTFESELRERQTRLTTLLCSDLGVPVTVESRQFVNLPGVALEPGSALLLPSIGFAVCILPEEIFEALDRDFSRRYSAGTPTFFVSLSEQAATDIEIAKDVLYVSLVACSGARIMHPDMSITYVSSFGAGVGRSVGPLDRQAVLGDGLPVRLSLSSDWSFQLDSICGLLSRHREVFCIPEIAFALRSLQRGGNLEMTSQEDLVLSIIALEELLIPERSNMITDKFARRVSSLISPAQSEEQQSRSNARALYRARSQLLHGESADVATPWDELVGIARYALSAAIIGTAEAHDLEVISECSIADFRDALVSGHRVNRYLMWEPHE
jgi:hypothetical protein